jgi:hypothetical protein
MAAENYEQIRAELESIRTEINRLSLGKAAGNSEWSVHANWKSSCGDISWESRVELPADRAAQIEVIAKDMNSERFMDVARSMKELITTR